MKSEIIKLESLADHIAEPVDLFICCASYESRCRSLADRLPLDRVRKAIVAETEHRTRYVSEHGDHLRALFGKIAANALLHPNDPVTTADALQRNLVIGLKGARRILVDITTFRHETLLILTKLLILNVKENMAVQFAYVGASEYSVGDKDDEKWLSKGVSDVRSVLGYPGVILPSRRQHLIVLVGFEHERASELIKAYEPSVISLGLGRSGTATSDKHDVANRHFHQLVTATASTYGEVRKFEFACDDPLDAQMAIERQIRGVRGHNTVVAPMNTKLSTLGVVLAAQQDESIQLCYARANQYNYRAYSSPKDECYLVTLPEMFAGGDSRQANADADPLASS
jgi:hypothetical protein